MGKYVATLYGIAMSFNILLKYSLISNEYIRHVKMEA